MKVGLVLSGGMAKGAYQVGALQAISEFFREQEPLLISASSVGVLNAYAFATGRINQAELMWEQICEDRCRKAVTQMLRSSLLQNSITTVADESELQTDCLYCTLLEMRSRNLVYQNLKNIPKQQHVRYLQASVAMPIYNRAVEIGNCAYYDGAMVDNIPVYPLMKYNLDYLLCIYFDDVSYRFENDYFDNKILKITFPSRSVVNQSIFFQRERIHEMIACGYERTAELLHQTFADGLEDTERAYRQIEIMNGRSERTLRITGDMMVTNLNRVTQRLTKRKIVW